MSSTYLDIRSVWKSLVASYARVAEVQTRVFNAFVSRAKSVRLWHNKRVCVSNSINAFAPVQ